VTNGSPPDKKGDCKPHTESKRKKGDPHRKKDESVDSIAAFRSDRGHVDSSALVEHVNDVIRRV
jgi:hypothetical protein